MSRRRVVVGAAVAIVIAAAVTAVVDPFAGTSPSKASGLDNETATSTYTVTRRDLSQETQVSATLGYADPSVIAVSAGTAPESVQQAQQAVTSAQAALQTAQATLADDTRALAQARATQAADRRKLAVDCGGTGAAGTGSSAAGGSGGSSGGSSTPCATDSQAATTDDENVTNAKVKVEGDRHSVSSAQVSLAAADQSLENAQSTASTVGQTSVYTMLPKVGKVVRRGEALYAIGGQPVVLLYGSVTPWRAFAQGMSPGADVAELNANLGLSGDAFTSQTAAAIDAFQSAHGLPVTGRLLLGAVVFEPGAVRVTSVTPTPGATVQAGPVLNVTSIRREVTIALDASQQTSVKVGDPVIITLPDNSTTPGHVSFVGTVATTPSSSNDNGNGSSTPTIEVDVTPDHPAATGRLDQAPVDVSITTATVKNVLVVPVNALLALAGGGYALELVEPGGFHRLIAAQVGLFDDAEGLVQVSGPQLRAGQRVVMPSQ